MRRTGRCQIIANVSPRLKIGHGSAGAVPEGGTFQGQLQAFVGAKYESVRTGKVRSSPAPKIKHVVRRSNHPFRLHLGQHVAPVTRAVTARVAGNKFVVKLIVDRTEGGSLKAIRTFWRDDSN